MGKHIYKSHNKTLLLYHFVFPLKYRKKIITEEIGVGLKEICIDISERYEINFVKVVC
jgi:REP element-mobilizing transposase RayT